jgi:glucosamine-6-phosphate deaminase
MQLTLLCASAALREVIFPEDNLMDLLTTISGSLMDGFLPKGWDLTKIDRLAALSPEAATAPQTWWSPGFQPVGCASIEDFDTYMGHEIAREIQLARQDMRDIVFILPVGPMGMYRWTVYFLKEWGVRCDHVHGFNMDEWSDAQGNTLPPNTPGAFQHAMEAALYGPLKLQTVPANQRHFAVKSELPTYAQQIGDLRWKGAKLVTVFGIGRVCHIAFWEPHFAAEFATEKEWRSQAYRVGARLHPLTIEQNALTSFRSRTTLVPAFANTIGPALFLAADKIIGGADGTLGRGMQWQGLSLRMTLLHEPTPWIPSSFMPTLAGRLFYLNELAGPLVADCH